MDTRSPSRLKCTLVCSSMPARPTMAPCNSCGCLQVNQATSMSISARDLYLESSKTPRMPLSCTAPEQTRPIRLRCTTLQQYAPDRDRTYDLTVTAEAVTAVRSNQLSYKSMPAFEEIRAIPQMAARQQQDGSACVTGELHHQQQPCTRNAVLVQSISSTLSLCFSHTWPDVCS